MRIRIQIAVILLILSLVSNIAVYAETSVEYYIQIDNDGSADWIIKQIREANSSIISDPLEDLQRRIAPLLEASSSQTQRNMTVEIVSFKSTLLGSYFLDEYRFHWRNFGAVENTVILVGDVFQVRDFFLQLYGNGEIYMTYPPTHTVEEPVKPPPFVRDSSQQLLGWPGTRDFDETGARIVFRQKSSTIGLAEILGQNTILLASLTAALVITSLAFFIFWHNRRERLRRAHDVQDLPVIESDEDRIVGLLRSSGGTLYQSAITDQCGFSRAKTSQILTAMEEKGIIRRLQKGRKKIVIFDDKSKK